MLIYYLAIAIFVFFILMTALEQDVMKAVMYFALSSSSLAVILYLKYKATYAAAFELAICAGLIVVLFMASISLITEPKEGE